MISLQFDEYFFKNNSKIFLVSNIFDIKLVMTPCSFVSNKYRKYVANFEIPCWRQIWSQNGQRTQKSKLAVRSQ